MFPKRVSTRWNTSSVMVLLKGGIHRRQFDLRKYLEINPDVAEGGINPLVHFVKYGIAEKRCAG